MKRVTLIFAAITVATNLAFSQGTAINTTGAAADNSAMLDVSSSAKGFLLPRMTNQERNNIISPAQSLLIFNTTTTCFEYYYNGVWYSMSCTCSVPAVPIATGATNITDNSFSANWSGTAGSATYYLDVSTDSAFGSFVSGYNNLNAGGGFTYSVSGLGCNTRYYYRVRVNNSCGTSANSNTESELTSACWSCGSSFTDSRDSKSYGTVQIAAQCWMAQNLDYGTFENMQTSGNQTPGYKYCMNVAGNNDASCPFGGLYEWNNFMNGSSACNGSGATQVKCSSPVQGLCPSGWHIPSHYEWTRLERVQRAALGLDSSDASNIFPYDNSTSGWLGNNEGDRLKQSGTTNWASGNNGNNLSGFTALPGGFVNNSVFEYYNGNGGCWWSSSEYNSTNPWSRILFYGLSSVHRDNLGSKASRAYSVRCVKD